MLRSRLRRLLPLRYPPGPRQALRRRTARRGYDVYFGAILRFASAALASHWGADRLVAFITGFLFRPFGVLAPYWMRDAAPKDQARIVAGEGKQCPECANSFD
jgi:hypothetical protein